MALTGVVAIVGAAALTTGCGGETGRQDDVAERGAQVMPFDLDSTTHRFTRRRDGGLQTVVSDDPDDAEQVRLVRSHLREEAERFAAGDFTDPAAIHGENMPGVRELSAGADRIDVVYASVDSGATLTFTTEDPSLVEAVHDWFDAQTSDHGDHAAA